MNTLGLINRNNFNGLNDIAEVRNLFYKKRITVSYEPIKEGRRRVIFTCIKSTRVHKFDKVCLECNGLIMEASDAGWKILLFPLLSPKTSVDSAAANRYIADDLYAIYKMGDGSVLNLYYYNDKWVISTARGIEMNDVIFNTKSYRDMLNEVLDETKTALYENLDKDKCYTLAIKHPDLHPFLEGQDAPIFRIWGIQQSDNKGNTAPIDFIPQERIDFKPEKIHNLYSRLAPALDEFTKSGKVNYGYVLISKTPEITGEQSVIMLESTLMRAIRNLWYNCSYVQFSNLHNYNRINVILMSAYLNPGPFLDLFPQFSANFEEFAKIEERAIRDIKSRIRGPDVGAADANVGAADAGHDADALADLVKNTITLSLYDDKDEKIKEVLHAKNNEMYFYTLLFGHKNN